MKRHILTAIFCIFFIACGSDEDDIEDRLDVLETKFERHRHHVIGNMTSEPIKTEPSDKRKHGNQTETIQDDTNLPTLPVLPQKGRIAFESNGDIYAIDSDGTNLTNLTNHMSPDSQPAWSPDGNQIAFVSERAGVPKIFTMDVSGNTQKLAIDMGDIYLSHPKWDPNGNTIIFTQGNASIFIGNNLKPIKIADGIYPTWSILGEIAFSSQGESTNWQQHIHVQSVHGGDAITIGEPWADHPAWSPDGRRIAYFANSGKHDEFDIFVMNADGSNKTNLTQYPSDDRAPAWSSDGKQIAFMSNRDHTFNWEIYVMNADGRNQRNITNNHQADDMYPTWRP